MKRTKRKFDDGDVIFREGDPSDVAFVVLSGRVELSAAGESGPVRLAMLKTGDLFGEVGILHGGVRSATATARGPVRAKVIERRQFLQSVQVRPEMALDVMGKLVHRLQNADAMLLRQAARGSREPAPAGQDGPGFLARLMSRDGGVRSHHIQVLVARGKGEAGEALTRAFVAAFEKRKGVRARVLDADLDPEPGADAASHSKADALARGRLVEHGGDVLIRAEAGSPGLTVRLRLLSALAGDEDTAGVFGTWTTLTLPARLDDPFKDYLYAVTLAAAVPATEGKAVTLQQALPSALEPAMAVLKDPSPDLTTREQAILHMGFGNAVAILAQHRRTIDLYRMAVAAYRVALDTISRDEMPLDWAFTQSYLGMLQGALAERADDAEERAAVAECCRAALSVLTRADFPRPWAAAQNRLGLALYRLDLESDDPDTDTLKHALTAFQAALQVYNRWESPLRWAEIMNNFAQAAQLLGERLHNPDVLEKAAEACRSALQVRRRERTPLLWAVTQNNLGSALFLLGKLNQDRQSLEGAADAFRHALDVHSVHGMQRMAAVVEKNLAHAERMLASIGQGRPVRRHWSEVETDEDERLQPVPD